MIFSGRVVAIAPGHESRRLEPSRLEPSDAIATVLVTLHVDRAIRGVRNGETLTIRQWAGVWATGQHYQVGQRLLLFLYPPSRLGLTSAVGGPLGRFALDSAGRIVLSPQQLSAFRADPLLSGKSRVVFSDLVQDVRRASGEN